MSRPLKFVVKSDTDSWMSTVQRPLQSQQEKLRFRITETTSVSHWLNQVDRLEADVAIIEISGMDDRALQQLESSIRSMKTRGAPAIWGAVGDLENVGDTGLTLKTLFCIGFDFHCRHPTDWNRLLPGLLFTCHRKAHHRCWDTANRATIENGVLERLPW